LHTNDLPKPRFAKKPQKTARVCPKVCPPVFTSTLS
jgi:hypothetical protein